MVGARPARRADEKRTLDRREIVAGVENAGVFGANGLRAIRGIVFAATGAFEVSQHADAEFSIGFGLSHSGLARYGAL